MSIEQYLSGLEPQRRILLSEIHQIILAADKEAIPQAGIMMGKEIIIYQTKGLFKYGLGSVKNHMSLHVFPMYCNPGLHKRYKSLLPKAVFQKGCINFKIAGEVPLNIIKQLIEDCSGMDPGKLMAEAKLNRKTNGV